MMLRQYMSLSQQTQKIPHHWHSLCVRFRANQGEKNPIFLSGKQKMQLSFSKNNPCQAILIFCLKTNPQKQ